MAIYTVYFTPSESGPIFDSNIGRLEQEMTSYLKKLTFSASITFLLVCAIGIYFRHSVGLSLLLNVSVSYGLVMAGLASLVIAVLLVVSFVKYLFARQYKSASLVFGICAVFLLSIGMVSPSFGNLKPFTIRLLCQQRMERLSADLRQYCDQHTGCLPVQKWCDALVRADDISADDLICPGRLAEGASYGECSYAMNVNVAGGNLSQLPPDTVVLFETDYAGKDSQQKIPLKEREENDSLNSDDLVREGAWNQVGDQSILTASHHLGYGCNILFADGHVDFVKKKDFDKLRWKP